jgi:hypothetical protein
MPTSIDPWGIWGGGTPTAGGPGAAGLAGAGGGGGGLAGATLAGLTPEQQERIMRQVQEYTMALLAKAFAEIRSGQQESRQYGAAQQAEARQRGQGGATGGFTEIQRAHALTGGSPEANINRAATSAMVNRQAKLRGQGFDPTAGYMRYVSPQMEQETDAEYFKRVEQGKGTYESQKAAARQKNIDRTAAQLRSKAERGAIGTMYGITAQRDAMTPDERYRRGRVVLQNPGAGRTERDFDFAQSVLDNPNAAPAGQPTEYTAAYRAEGAPETTFVRGNPSVDAARQIAQAGLAGQVDAEEELRRRLAQLVGPGWGGNEYLRSRYGG